MAWDMTSWGTDWLDEQRREFMAVTIVYLRNSSERFTAQDATSCKITHRVLVSEVETEINGRDFIIPRHYFEGDLPIAGDIIQLTINSETVDFRVAPITGESIYRDHDPQRKAIRIHTILDQVT